MRVIVRHLRYKGIRLGPHVSSNDPKREGVPPATFQSIGDDPADQKTASVLREFVRQSTEILSSHPVNRERISRGLPPANTVLCRGAGIMGNFEPFQEKYGMRGAVISAATLITGIGKVVGLVHIPVPGATGSSDSNIEGKITAAIRVLNDRDFVLVNIKGADEAGHDGHALEKRDFISRIDGAIEPLLDLGDCLLVVCADHSTPCSIKDHSADPVPLVIRGDGVRVDHVTGFNECACAEGGGLHRITGYVAHADRDGPAQPRPQVWSVNVTKAAEVLGLPSIEFVEPSFADLIDSRYNALIASLPGDEGLLLVDETG